MNTEKECQQCRRRVPEYRRTCACGSFDFLALGIGEFGIDSNLEPTVGLGGGVSVDITDGGVNFLGIDGDHLTSIGGVAVDAAGAVVDVAGDVVGGAVEIIGDLGDI